MTTAGVGAAARSLANVRAALPLGIALAAAVLAAAAIAQYPLYGIVAVGAALLALAVVVWPDLAALVVVFLLFVNAPAVAVRFHGAPLVLGLVLILFLVVPFANHLLRGAKPIVTPGFFFVIVLLVVQIVSTLLSREVNIAWENVQTFLVEGVALYFLLTNVIRTPEMLRRTTWTLLAAGAFLAALSVFQELTGTYSRPYGGFAQLPREFFTGHLANPRLAGPIGDPNYYAQMLLILVPLGVMTVVSERQRSLRLVALATTGLLAYAVTLTFSRGAGLAFFLVFVLMAILRYVKAYQVVLLVVGVFLLLAAVPAYQERISTLSSVTSATEGGGGSGADESLRSRLTEGLAAALVFADHPLLGVGPGVFPSYYQEYAALVGIEVRETVEHGARRGEEARRESHNMFLSIAADLGVFGLAAFVAILFVTLRALARARRLCLAVRPDLAHVVTGFMLAIVAYVTAGFFLTLAFERYFWLLMALSGAAAWIGLKEAERAAGDAPARSQARAPEDARAPAPPLSRRLS